MGIRQGLRPIQGCGLVNGVGIDHEGCPLVSLCLVRVHHHIGIRKKGMEASRLVPAVATLLPSYRGEIGHLAPIV